MLTLEDYFLFIIRRSEAIIYICIIYLLKVGPTIHLGHNVYVW